MTVTEALRNYHRDFAYWLNMCNDDVNEVNFYTSGTPEFSDMDEALDYFNKLGELLEEIKA